jgi:1-acyl-sn-glycerol-3-phosphate acyltransferase
MIWLRSLLFFICLIVYTPIYAIFCLVTFPFLNQSARYRVIQFWCKSIIYFLELFCQVRFQVIGQEHIDAVIDQPVIILSKHQSAWETIAFLQIFPKELCFVFKRELLWIPFFGWVIALLNMIHINRADKSSSGISVANQGKDRLKAGKWIILFPEGTRTPVGSHKPYRKGGARLASLTNATVLPVAHNAGHCWPRNSFMKYPGLITVSIGPAISSTGKSGDELHNEVENWIEGEMRRIDPGAYQR